MKTLKRVVAVIAIIVSVLVLLISVGGLAGSWAVNGALTNAVTRVLTGVERALDVTDNGLERVDARVEGARANVDMIEEAVTRVGDDVKETSFALLLIEKTVGEELLPKIDSARETLSTVRASVIAFNDALEAANELPFVSTPTLTEELEAASERVSEAQTSVEEIKTSVDVAKSEAVEGVVTFITSRTSKIDSALADLQATVADYRSQISAIEEEVASLESTLTFWIDVMAIVMMLWFLWIAISQVAVLGLSWSYLRRGELALGRRPETARAEESELIQLEEPPVDQQEEPEGMGEEDQLQSDQGG